MKRRKQFLALSLAALMVVGGVFNPSTLSSVQAEEAQTEQAGDLSGDNAGDLSGDNAGDLSGDNAVTGKTVTVSLDITAGLEEGKTYMDEMVSVGTTMAYTSGSVALQYVDGTDAGSAPGYVTVNTNADTSNGTGNLIRFTPKYDGTIYVGAQLNDKKGVCVATSDGQEVFSYTNNQGAKLNMKLGEAKVEAGKTYYIYGVGTKPRFYGITYTYKVEADEEDQKPTLPDIDLVEGVLAFPTAEGGGRLATGGRGGDVYVVTNLDDDGEGSLRYGINTAPASGRIIVFNVGGTIHLKSTLGFSGKKNITIAGQTAPGDGITIAGYDTNISDSENIVIRFVRFRVGTENLLNGGDSMDALWGRDNDTFMIDHCTFSWNTDETLSTYRGKNGTVQWCLVSESLTVSGHSKGRHGYGGIFGGDNTVFQYNLLANHTSRNPRIGGGSMTDPTAVHSMATLQLSNNVLYNHGYFACYGGGYTYTNFINNYTKPGQGTRDALVNTILGFGENTKDGGVYYAGNILEGNEAVTNDNSLGFSLDGKDGLTVVSDVPYESEAFDNITLRSAADCYELVLNSAGATYPHRDAVDARVVAQVRSDSGTYINTQDEVGGYPAEDVVSDLVDTDGDGIPDDWETAHGLDPNDSTDSRTLCLADKDDVSTYGYAWIEVYFNEMVGEVSEATYVAENPTVSIDLADNTLVNEGDSVTVTAAASSEAGIEKVVFFNGAEAVATVTEAPYTYTYTDSIAKDGTYHISVRAYDKNGNKTQSNTSRLHVNSTAGTGEWLSTDVGNPEVKGTASLVDGVLTVKGAGKLGASEGSNKNVRPELADATTDDFHYVYQQLEGDIEIITRFDSYIPVDNHTFQGLMFRSSLDTDAATAALGFTMVKVDETTIWSAFMVDRTTDGGKIKTISETIDSPEAAARAGIPLIANLPFKEGNDYLGTWLKLAREGDNFTGYVSSDGLVWQKVGTLTVDLPDTAYVGFAVEANRAGNDLINYSTAKFSNIEINEEFAHISYDTTDVEVAGAEKLAFGKDLAVTLTKVTGYVLPEEVTVVIDGKFAEAGKDYTYDAETGLIQIENVQSDISIIASGVKRVVVPVEYEEVDENNLLEVKEEAGKLILTQTATSGNMQVTDKNSGEVTAASNVSYLLFPEVDEYHKLSMDVTVKSLTTIDKGDKNGFFVGAFATDGSGIYTTLGFRANNVLKGYWYKPGGTAGNYTGDGNPGGTVTLDTVYHVDFVTDGKGGYNAIVSGTDGTSFTKQMKAGESAIATGDKIRYGMAILGATVEISNMKLVDPENNVIYNQSSADYSAVIAAIQKASELEPEDYDNFDEVQAAWDAIDLSLNADEQEKVDAMAKALEDAIAKLEKKSVKTETIPGVVIDEALESVMKDKGLETADDVKEFMKKTVVKEEFAGADYSIVDVTVKVKLSADGEWVKATAETFPKEGVEVVLPYPTGSDSSYQFSISHLVTMTCNGLTAGQVEYPEILAKTDEGLKIRIFSASPFAISYAKDAGEPDEPTKPDEPTDPDEPTKPEEPTNPDEPTKPTEPSNPAAPDSDDDDDDDDAAETGTNVSTQATKTGDNMNVGVIIWSIVLLAVVAGAGVMFYFRKRRLDGSNNE